MKVLLNLIGLLGLATAASSQQVLFDFDDVPAMHPFPIDVLSSGISAHLTATGQGYSIQQVGTVGIAPSGFSGNCIFPSSVYGSDLLIQFSEPLQAFSIMYSPQELACDSSATMRVTAYTDSTLVGTQTTTAPVPGTWPTGVLSFNTAQSFNRVVVNYDARPPTGGDWGPIFLADNMTVSRLSTPLAGIVHLTGFNGMVSSQVFNFTLMDQLGTVVDFWAQNLDSTGHFAHAASVTLGSNSYRLVAQGSHWLGKAANVNTNNALSLSFTPVNGDCDGNNVIDLTDYTMLLMAFNASSSSANWDPMADLDGDDIVDLTDYTILVTNFNAIGD